MIRSMTGFGAAEGECDGRVYAVEVRSVNHRYLKTSFRYPEDHGFLEPQLERLLRERLARGAVTLRVFVRQPAAAAAQSINLPLLEAYVEALQRVAAAHPAARVDVASVAALPGVLDADGLDEAARERVSGTVAALVDSALDQLIASRAREGATIAADLGQHVALLRRCRDEVAARAPVVVAEYSERLHTRVQQLLAGSGVELAKDDLRREVAMFAERSDINEEVQRLVAHLDSIAQALDAPEAAGRRLDFISQELLRETNTIGSKANDATIAQRVIEMKTAIDRIKEQVQNVE